MNAMKLTVEILIDFGDSFFGRGVSKLTPSFQHSLCTEQRTRRVEALIHFAPSHVSLRNGKNSQSMEKLSNGDSHSGLIIFIPVKQSRTFYIHTTNEELTHNGAKPKEPHPFCKQP